MVTDLNPLLPKDYKQLYWFTKGDLSKVFKLPALNSLELLLVQWQSIQEAWAVQVF